MTNISVLAARERSKRTWITSIKSKKKSKRKLLRRNKNWGPKKDAKPQLKWAEPRPEIMLLFARNLKKKLHRKYVLYKIIKWYIFQIF